MNPTVYESTSAAELAAEREQFFVPVDIEKDAIFCGDDREAEDGNYVHVFGGVLFVAYNRLVAREIVTPGQSSTTFAEEAVSVVPILKEKGIPGGGVHSDDAAEGGNVFLVNRADGKVGCGYAFVRRIISQLIDERGEEILADAQQLFPEAFIDDDSFIFGRNVIAAHGRLANPADPRISNGRDVVRGAAQAGAKTMLVFGKHGAKVGFINTKVSESYNTTAAMNAGLPAYDHDLAASNEMWRRLHEDTEPVIPMKQYQIASIIDAVGTMRALGVETIIRR